MCLYLFNKKRTLAVHVKNKLVVYTLAVKCLSRDSLIYNLVYFVFFDVFGVCKDDDFSY
jgi:hypothetical protein